MAKSPNPDIPFGGYIYRMPASIIASSKDHPLLDDVMLTRVGYFIHAQDHHMTRRTINEYILIYCTAGKGWLEQGDQRWLVEKGMCAFVLKNMPHTYYADADDPWTIYWAHLRGKKVAHYLEMAHIAPDSPICTIGTQNTLPFLFQEMGNILQLGYGLHQIIWATQCLCQVLAYLGFQTTYIDQSERHTLNIEETIRFMLDRLTQTCTLQTFADYASMSPSHFSRRFRDKTGYAPIDYFIRLKIQKACELLDLTAMSVQEISDYLGYSTPYYFSRIFKKITGQSPRDYRQSL